MTQLVLGLGAQDHVVHKDQNVALLTLLKQPLLLLQQLVDQGLIPFVKEETGVPLGVLLHHRLQNWAARRGPDEPNDQIEIIKQPVHEVHRRR